MTPKLNEQIIGMERNPLCNRDQRPSLSVRQSRNWGNGAATPSERVRELIMEADREVLEEPKWMGPQSNPLTPCWAGVKRKRYSQSCLPQKDSLGRSLRQFSPPP